MADEFLFVQLKRLNLLFMSVYYGRDQSRFAKTGISPAPEGLAFFGFDGYRGGHFKLLIFQAFGSDVSKANQLFFSIKVICHYSRFLP
jgi:hypothetical protein